MNVPFHSTQKKVRNREIESWQGMIKFPMKQAKQHFSLHITLTEVTQEKRNFSFILLKTPPY